MGVLSKFVDGGSGGSRSTISTLLEAVLRFFQIIFGITVIGLYAQVVDKVENWEDDFDGRIDFRLAKSYPYTVAIGVISVISAIIYLILPIFLPRLLRLPLFFYDLFLFFNWVIVFGIFGNIFLKIDPFWFDVEGGADLKRMRDACYIDMINMLLWFVGGVWAGIRWRKGRNGGSGGESYEVRQMA
ncbi:hypothetical protein FQN54_005474 [Arachnomyces sp. PD_36]|nr:hypothetical protein FQN54_005474 [Arachnomyces sp. PD_36]